VPLASVHGDGDSSGFESGAYSSGSSGSGSGGGGGGGGVPFPPAVGFAFSYRLVAVDGAVTQLLERFLSAHIVRPADEATRVHSGGGGASGGSPYVPAWRAEALLGDLARQLAAVAAGGDSGGNGGDEDNSDEDKSDEADGDPAALMIFLLNPRRTFVSNFHRTRETYG